MRKSRRERTLQIIKAANHGLDPCCQLSLWIKFYWTKSMAISISELSVVTFKIYESVLRSSKGNTEASEDHGA